VDTKFRIGRRASLREKGGDVNVHVSSTGFVGCTTRINVGINDRILTEDLNTISEGIPLGYIDQ
jgi:hypothetical protein